MTAGSTRGRPRRAETDERVLRATSELLRERGPAGVTIESVSARSGVARTTIYRRYASRRDLVSAAMAPVAERPAPPAGLSLEGAVRWLLEQVEELLEVGLGRGEVAALLGDTDPEFTEAMRQALRQQVELVRQQVEPVLAEGDAADGTDPDAVVGLLLGAYLGEVLRHGHPRRGWAGGATALVTRALRADAP